MEKFLIALLLVTSPVQAQSWTIERHGDTWYGRGPHHQSWIEYERNGVIYHHNTQEHNYGSKAQH